MNKSKSSRVSETRHSEYILEQMSEHITYEFFMFCSSHTITEQRPHQLTMNFAIESFIIHTRILLHFFHHETVGNIAIRKNDVFFSDFIQGTWNPDMPPFDMAEYKKRCNHQVAHITTDRLKWSGSPAAKIWNDKETIYIHFISQWFTFLSKLEEHKRLWFDKYMSQWDYTPHLQKLHSY